MKAILPSVASQFSYNDLEVRDGSDAMLLYASLNADTPVDELEKSLRELLDYCRMDTLGVFYVFEYLRKVVS
jgi:hypothetical protein